MCDIVVLVAVAIILVLLVVILTFVFDFRLSNCGLTRESCSILAIVLTSDGCELRELDLTKNNIQDSGVRLLCNALENPHCKLEKLR